MILVFRGEMFLNIWYRGAQEGGLPTGKALLFMPHNFMCFSNSGPGILSGVKKKREETSEQKKRKKKAEQLWVIDKGNSYLMNQSWETNTIKTAVFTVHLRKL